MGRRDAAAEWALQAAAPREARLLRDDRLETFGRNVSGQFEPSSPLVGRPARRGAGVVPFVSLPLGEIVHVAANDPGVFGHNGGAGTEVIWEEVDGERFGFFNVPGALPTTDLPYTGVAAPIDVSVRIEGDPEAEPAPIPAGTRVEVRRNGTTVMPADIGDVEWRAVTGMLTAEPVGRAHFSTGSDLSVAIIPPEGETVEPLRVSMTVRIPDPTRLQRPSLPPPTIDVPEAGIRAQYAARLQGASPTDQLLDFSGQGRTVTLAGATWEDDQIGGEPAWGGAAMEGGLGNFDWNNHMLWVFVARRGASGARHTLAGRHTSQLHDAWRTGANASDEWEMEQRGAGGTADTSWHILGFAGGDTINQLLRIWVDGQQVVDTTHNGTPPRDSMRPLCHRTFFGVGQQWNGQFAEGIAYSWAGLSVAQLETHAQGVFAALSSIYGIALP